MVSASGSASEVVSGLSHPLRVCPSPAGTGESLLASRKVATVRPMPRLSRLLIAGATIGSTAVVGLGTGTEVSAQTPPPPTIVVNVSCGSQMNLDATFAEAPTSPWTLNVFIDGTDQFTLEDNDGDLMGFHPVIPAAELPSVSYSYSVDASNGAASYDNIASGSVVCTNTAAPPRPPTSAVDHQYDGSGQHHRTRWDHYHGGSCPDNREYTDDDEQRRRRRWR